jgi:hypothetical protein
MMRLNKELLGDNLLEALKRLTFSLSKASTVYIILAQVSLNNILLYVMIVHLRIGV